jgi:hypothetical protein
VIKKLSDYSTGLLYGTDDQHSVPTAQPQNSVTDAPATASPASAPSIAYGSTPAATVEPVAAASDDHSGMGHAPASEAQVSPSPTEVKAVDPSQIPTPPAVEGSDNNQPDAGHAATNDSLPQSVANGDDDKQAATPPPKPPNRKRPLDSPSTVEGFIRHDVPDLLRQADSYAARGNYRLARYEYGLVLKLDRNNAQAREGLRRLMATWQER